MNSIHKNLTRRYLIWAYKTTRESFERIERKTTQLVVDQFILEKLEKNSKGKGLTYQQQVKDFKQYIADKKSDELKQKFAAGKKKNFNPQYLYLKDRLEAIEKAIQYFLGPKELKNIQTMFEGEFTSRIWQAREH